MFCDFYILVESFTALFVTLPL